MGLLNHLKQKKRGTPLTWEHTPSPVAQEYVDTDGRRHRADAPYLLPKDEKEMLRLDYQHFILRQVLKGNCFAPVHHLLYAQGGAVLDVGSGSGRWGHELAATYPKAQVYGFDLEEVSHTTSTPRNYQFHQGNLLNGLPFVSHSFHYVHQRLLVAAIPLEKWPWVIGELKRVTQPQGWIELVEMGNTFHNAGPATKQFLAWWRQISASRGIDASNMSQIGGLLQQRGLSAIQAKTKLVPVGSWGGRLGNLLAQDILAGWPTMRPLAQTSLGISSQTFDEIIGRLEAEWNTFHTSYEVYFACGQV